MNMNMFAQAASVLQTALQFPRNAWKTRLVVHLAVRPSV